MFMYNVPVRAVWSFFFCFPFFRGTASFTGKIKSVDVKSRGTIKEKNAVCSMAYDVQCTMYDLRLRGSRRRLGGLAICDGVGLGVGR